MHDAGEQSEEFLNISGGQSGAGNYASGDAGGGTQRGRIWTDAQIDTSLQYTRSYLASSCIRLEEKLPRLTHEPPGSLFRQPHGFFDIQTDNTTGNMPSRDETLVQGLRTGSTQTQQFVDVWYVAPFPAVDGGWAVQYRPGFVDTFPAPKPFDFINQLFISRNTAISNVHFALFHELGHQLANKRDTATLPHIAFRTTGAAVGDGRAHNSKRRVRSEMSNWFRTDRGANESNVGNNFLQDP